MPSSRRLSQAVAAVCLAAAALACSDRPADSLAPTTTLPPPPEAPLWTAESCPAGARGDSLTLNLGSYDGGSIGLGDTLTVQAWVYVNKPFAETKCNLVFAADTSRFRVLGGNRIVAVKLGASVVTARVPTASQGFTLTVVPPPTFMPRRYRVIDVGDTVAPFRMNARHEILFTAPGKPSMWRDGAATPIDCTIVYAFNNLGDVLCRRDGTVGILKGGAFAPVVGLGADGEIQYLQMNDSGVVAGIRRPREQNYWGAAFIAKGEISGDFFQSQWLIDGTAGLNNKGQLVAYDFGPLYTRSVFIVDRGGLVEQTGVGVPTGMVFGINDNGILVGTSAPHPGSARAFIKQVKGQATTIEFGAAKSINNLDEVVGDLFPASYPWDVPQTNFSLRGPFFWDRAGGIKLLRNAALDPQWTITSALQIIDDGSILARANNDALGIRNHVVLLSPK